MLAIEGLYFRPHRLDKIDFLYEQGFRIIGPVHFCDNEFGGSAHGVSKAGLLPFGREALPYCESKQPDSRSRPCLLKACR